MTHELIESIIDSVSDPAARNRIFMRPLRDNVWTAHVWLNEPQGFCGQDGYKFYFIYNESDCVAAVFVMGTCDLHCFVKESFRRNGIMSRALKDIILPHLFLDGRCKQKVTFIDSTARGLVEKIGFHIIDDTSAEITADKCAKVFFPAPAKVICSEERVIGLKQRFSSVRKILKDAHSQCKIYFERDFIYKIYLREREINNIERILLSSLPRGEDRALHAIIADETEEECSYHRNEIPFSESQNSISLNNTIACQKETMEKIKELFWKACNLLNMVYEESQLYFDEEDDVLIAIDKCKEDVWNLGDRMVTLWYSQNPGLGAP
jgi:hypothetical protein